MNQRTTCWLFAAIVAAAACARITPPPSPETTHVDVVVAASLAQAYGRTVDAFLAEGLAAGPGSQPNGTLVSQPTTFGNVGNPLTYRALLVVMDSQTTRIVLSGTIRNGLGSEDPLHSQMTGWLAGAWQHIQHIADG